MSLGFLRREELINEITAEICDREYGRSWNIGIPPCFEPDATLDMIVHNLRAQPRIVVAELTSDTLKGADAYIHKLHSQWSQQVSLPPLQSTSPDSMFEHFIASLPTTVTFVQVVRQFHKIIESVGVTFLAMLRDAEQERAIRTVTATPLIIPDLKKRWDRNHPCTTSGYGNGHAELYVQCHPEHVVIDHVVNSGISKGIASFLAAQSGGYPECVSELMKVLHRTKSQSLTPLVKESLRTAAINTLRRFIDLIDDSSQTVYRNAVVDLHHGVDTEDALDQCRMHPWAKILLNDDDELRSPYVGDAAVEDMRRDISATGTKGGAAHDRFSQALKAYKAGKFGDAANLFSAIPQSRRQLEVAKAISEVMKCLYSEDAPGEDSDWAGVILAAKRARATFAETAAFQRVGPFLASRLERIETVGERIVALQKRNEKRVVDALSGMKDDESRCEESAVFLLLCKFKTCNAISGHAKACQASLALPEQLLRVWAFWGLGVNYYSAPANADAIWEAAASEWPSTMERLRRSEPSKPFSSFVAFGYFLLALARERGMCADKLPVKDFAELQSVFSSYEQLRNPQAHSYCFTTRKERERFFTLADRWLNCVLLVYPGKMTRNDLNELLEPLPLLGRDGELIC
jgi:hypothetical protein